MNTTIELAPGAHTRLRITRRGRAVLTAIAGVPLVVGALALALNGGLAAADGSTLSGSSMSADTGGSATTFDYVTIQSGQSLWQLAERIAPSADPREVIAEIVNLNQLPSESVQPGQRLALPAEY
ncbi:LysM peptidoglycan-binding domain-containing protein [Cryobacterium sp. GrIS_2_6]|uniref:LysM peptidoglycan-binding domain-containing protein n=1 Tax=Cryobacterium sp. GrIS_2_6 TaxID=3162785 RepID=UPI002DFB6E74|nr:LysM repeat protein [Cryobacterium psychrotolerans]